MESWITILATEYYLVMHGRMAAVIAAAYLGLASFVSAGPLQADTLQNDMVETMEYSVLLHRCQFIIYRCSKFISNFPRFYVPTVPENTAD
jgi:hypothetical protein